MKHVWIFALIGLAAVPGLAAADGDEPAGPGWRATGSADVGFDSFEERYSIVDEDTLDSITEVRTRLALGLARGNQFRNYFHAEGRTLFGDDSAEYTGRLTFTRRLRADAGRVGLYGDITRRAFRDNSSYEFANDHSRYYLRSYLRWKVGPSVAVRLSDRLEHLDYEERTEFDYNYTRNSITLQGEVDLGLASYLSAGTRFTTMSIPDSTDIQYESWTPLVELRVFATSQKRMTVLGGLERRHYAHEPTRSSFWALNANAEAEWPLDDAVSLEVENDTERYAYDNPTSAYFNYTENRSAVLVNLRPSWNLTLGAGPTFGWHRSSQSPEDEYSEAGATLRVEYIRGARLWVSAAYEPGRRDYDAFTGAASATDQLIVFSDYSYHRVSAFVNLRLWDGVSANALLDYQPEDHEREGDDSTATLFSASISYAF